MHLPNCQEIIIIIIFSYSFLSLSGIQLIFFLIINMKGKCKTLRRFRPRLVRGLDPCLVTLYSSE
jgi:hypothetical protein